MKGYIMLIDVAYELAEKFKSAGSLSFPQYCRFLRICRTLHTDPDVILAMVEVD